MRAKPKVKMKPSQIRSSHAKGHSSGLLTPETLRPTLVSPEILPIESWNRPRLEEILGQHQGKKILVIGDVGIDRYTIGTVERISPEAPVPIVLVQDETLKLGLAANVADNIRALGGEPFLIGVVGKDRGAVDFRALLEETRIDHAHLVVDRSRRTVLKERVVSERQQLLRIDYESPHPLNSEVEMKMMSRVKALISEVDAVVIEDYGKGALTETMMKAIFNLAKRSGKVVAVDPNLKTEPHFYRGAPIVTPNTKEAEHLSGISIRDENSVVEAGLRILSLTQGHAVVITRGKEGMAIFTRSTTKSKSRHGGKGEIRIKLIPTFARDVYDVSGAGDTVISVLALSLVSGASIEEAAILGNLAAGIEVGKRGTATVSPDEILQAMQKLSTPA